MNRERVPSEYQINREIANLALHFSNSGRGNQLPPIHIPNTSGSSEWPNHIPVYAISINNTRRERFKHRFKYPSNIWEGTNGKTMDVGKLKREGILMSSSLTRGEIGCYDSHLRLWEKLIREKTPMAIICEDDVNLTGDTNQAKYFNTLLEEIKSSNFDILFLSWFRPNGGVNATSHTRHQWCFNQLWAYLVTYEGLLKVMNDIRVRKMHMPVDVALWDAHSRGVLKNIVAYPPLCLTVGEHSDTRNIR
jgi:GR25 family glycosyltransferase involved in LPS biosynthesis